MVSVRVAASIRDVMREDLLFNPQVLSYISQRVSEAYVSNRPFPHIVLNEFLPTNIAERLLREFPQPESKVWCSHIHEHSKKLACSDISVMPGFIRSILHELNSSVFVNFLELLSGIEGLIPDPYLFGGGMHQIEPGGYLDIHADFNYHPRLKLRRRMNVLLYLNQGWHDAYGGELELWNSAMTVCRRIAPHFNTLVVFETSDTSYHGHPKPLRCPVGQTRKSIATYYYTTDPRALAPSNSHSTLYMQRGART